jgi:ankyrin repeat protein
MLASWNGHHDIVRTLLEAKADINAMTNVRNQMMMIILLTIFLMLMMMMMMMMIVINDEDRDVCR